MVSAAFYRGIKFIPLNWEPEYARSELDGRHKQWASVLWGSVVPRKGVAMNLSATHVTKAAVLQK